MGVDIFANIKYMPNSANLQLLYVYFTAQVAINYTLPLSLVFAMISSKFSLIRSNELISLYTCGIPKNRVITPLFFISMFIILVLIGLNCTSFTNANEYKKNIIDFNKVSTNSTKLFLKYDNYYIYIKSLDAVTKTAYDMKIFETQNTDLISIIDAKTAKFTDNSWYIKQANQTTFPTNMHLGAKGLQTKTVENLKILKGFKPNIIDSVSDGKVSLNIIDAIDAALFLHSQNAKTTNIRATIYTLVVFPFFAPLMIVILFYYLPIISRYFNLALLSFVYIFVTLCVWGVLFVIIRFSANSVLIPELGILTPMLLMAMFALRLYIKNR